MSSDDYILIVKHGENDYRGYWVFASAEKSMDEIMRGPVSFKVYSLRAAVLAAQKEETEYGYRYHELPEKPKRSWSEAEINGIIGQCNMDGVFVDVFSKEFYVVVVVESKNKNKEEWISSRFDYHHVTLGLADFEDCEDEDSVRDTFNDIVRGQVREMVE